MIEKINNKIIQLKKISLQKYLYYNYFCKNIIRHGNGKIIPNKNTCIDFEKDSELHLYNSSLEIGVSKLSKSRAETYLRMRSNSKWIVKDFCAVSYGSTIEILPNGLFETNYFTMNINSTIIVKKHIKIGNNVMIGRNVTIYDSDFHDIYDNRSNIINNDGAVIIDNDVWIGSNCLILKNTFINSNAIIGANTTISGYVKGDSITINRVEKNVVKEKIKWTR